MSVDPAVDGSVIERAEDRYLALSRLAANSMLYSVSFRRALRSVLLAATDGSTSASVVAQALADTARRQDAEIRKTRRHIDRTAEGGDLTTAVALLANPQSTAASASRAEQRIHWLLRLQAQNGSRRALSEAIARARDAGTSSIGVDTLGLGRAMEIVGENRSAFRRIADALVGRAVAVWRDDLDGVAPRGSARFVPSNDGEDHAMVLVHGLQQLGALFDQNLALVRPFRVGGHTIGRAQAESIVFSHDTTTLFQQHELTPVDATRATLLLLLNSASSQLWQRTQSLIDPLQPERTSERFGRLAVSLRSNARELAPLRSTWAEPLVETVTEFVEHLALQTEALADAPKAVDATAIDRAATAFQRRMSMSVESLFSLATTAIRTNERFPDGLTRDDYVAMGVEDLGLDGDELHARNPPWELKVMFAAAGIDIAPLDARFSGVPLAVNDVIADLLSYSAACPLRVTSEFATSSSLRQRPTLPTDGDIRTPAPPGLVRTFGSVGSPAAPQQAARS